MISDDLLCVTCEYNLRTLQENGRCPECGTPVAHTLEMCARKHHVGSRLAMGCLIIPGLGLFCTYFVWPEIFSRDLALLLLACGIVVLAACVTWLAMNVSAGFRKRGRLDQIICLLVLLLGTLIGGLFVWLAYIIRYVAPNWG